MNDPSDEEHNRLRDINNFHHILHNRDENKSKPVDSVKHSVTATRILEQLSKKKTEAVPTEKTATSSKMKIYSDAVTGVEMSKGNLSGEDTDGHERPPRVDEIKMLRIQILSNPVKEAEESERKRIQDRSDARKREDEARKASALGRNTRPLVTKRPAPSDDLTSGSPGPSPVGKYLPKGVTGNGSKKAVRKVEESDSSKPSSVPSRLPPPPKRTKFNDLFLRLKRIGRI